MKALAKLVAPINVIKVRQTTRSTLATKAIGNRRQQQDVVPASGAACQVDEGKADASQGDDGIQTRASVSDQELIWPDR
jgi:hypothetical protein